MADHNDPRNRASDSYEHEPEPAQDLDAARDPREDDPLAELARLIQSEPFADLRRRPHSEADPYAADAGYGADSQGYDTERSYGDERGYGDPGYDGAGYDGARQAQDDGYAPQDGYRQAGYDQPDYDQATGYDRPAAADDDWPQPYVTPATAPAYNPFAAAVHQAPAPAARHYDRRSYVDPRTQAADPHRFHARTFATQTDDPYVQAPAGTATTGAAAVAQGVVSFPPEDAGYPHEPEQAADPFAPPGYAAGAADPATQGESAAADAQDHQNQDHQYQDRQNPFLNPPPFPLAAGQAPPDDFYDEPVRGQNRKGLMVAAAVVCLALFGTAGAFAYRAIFAGPSGPPPVIRASTEPTKIEPPPQKAEDPAASARLTYDRFGHRDQGEKLVPREERPVDISSLVRNSGPAAGGPSAADAAALQGMATGSPVPSSQPSAGLPPNVLAEPRRVRSVPVRPDLPEGAPPSAVTPGITPQSVAGSRPGMQAPPPPVPPRPSQDTRSEAPSASPPRTIASAVPSNMPLDVTPQASARPAPPPPAAPPPQAQPRTSGAPLSLVPGGGAPAPSQAAPPPPRVAALPPSGGSGFAVQVTSQRSESEAQNAYRALQSRFSGVLGGQSSFIRRADLGERGTFYRALVGPFGSRAEAVQLCASLRAAGGDCLVQSN